VRRLVVPLVILLVAAPPAAALGKPVATTGATRVFSLPAWA